MKKFLCLWLLFFCFASIVYAHDSETSGNASVIIHIDPNDAPKPGKSAFINIDIEDRDKNFNLNYCDCELTVSYEGKSLLERKLIPKIGPGLFNIKPLQFVFPNEGKFDISVSGKPTIAGLFTPFNTDYDINITNNSQSSHTHNDSVSIFSDILLGLVVTGGVLVYLSERKWFKN